jgi:CheY-like chemotaxis protein/anti-sigma regulatory factor (Ser/Thr protein kinase)
MTFAEASREKGLSLRAVQSSLWVRSDVILLERILLNLVSNAVRYTVAGSVIVGCRRRDGQLRVEVWDSGPGIPEGQRQSIFGEFYRLPGTETAGPGGLGLGLAIVDRLCRLLGHPIELTSTVGKGSCFCVTVPLAAAQSKFMAPSVVPEVTIDGLKGKLIVVIDDDKLILEGMGGLLQKWGCRIVAAGSQDEALADLDRQPDLIISDCHLSDGNSGVDAIKRLRNAFQAPIPAFLLSGDTAARRLREAQVSGFHLLYKPVNPMTLRAILNKLLSDHDVAGAAKRQAMPRAL